MESEQATPVDSIKDIVRSSVKVPEVDKHLKKARGHIGRNVMEITIKMKTIVRKPLMLKIIKLRLRNLVKLKIKQVTQYSSCNNNKLKLYLYTNIPPHRPANQSRSREWTCPHGHNGRPQHAIHDSTSSKLGGLLNAMRLSADFDNLSNSITLVEDILLDAQYGFCTNWGTTDMIFLWQIQEKCIEQNMPVFMISVDFTKVFDTVNREAL